jgi:hypothetical protein
VGRRQDGKKAVGFKMECAPARETLTARRPKEPLAVETQSTAPPNLNTEKKKKRFHSPRTRLPHVTVSLQASAAAPTSSARLPHRSPFSAQLRQKPKTMQPNACTTSCRCRPPRPRAAANEHRIRRATGDGSCSIIVTLAGAFGSRETCWLTVLPEE